MYIKTTKKLIFTIENTKNISRQKNKKNEPKHKITKKNKGKKIYKSYLTFKFVISIRDLYKYFFT